MLRLLLLLALLMTARTAMADFTVKDDGGALNVAEDGVPVVTYHYAQVTPPEGVDAHYMRAAYFHPLHDLSGNVISEDFPEDHYHHRGVFWAWPESTVGDRLLDVWALQGVRPRSVNTEVAQTGPDQVVLVLDNMWSYDDAPATAVLREHIVTTIHKREGARRAIDFELTFTNTSQEVLTLRGSTANIAKDDPTPKGYGGFSYRPRAEHKPFTFTGAEGNIPEDVLQLDSTWADVSFLTGAGERAGVAIVQHPENPGYPGDGWILRHYAFLGASWPHRDPWPLQPEQSVTVRYRLIVHDGTAEEADIAAAAKVYTQDK